jgi:amino acid adenylation domain-containing protein
MSQTVEGYSQSVEGYRLSPQQKRVWQLQREGLAPRSDYSLTLTGPLKPEALREALGRVVARHEILRTAFHNAPGVALPLQVIGDGATLDWRVEDQAARAHGDDDPAALFEELAAAESPAPGAQASPLAATLVKLGEERHALHLSLPALCADARTFGNLTRELAGAYAAALAAADDDGEAVQYLQFSEWQNELLEDENASLGFAFWRGQGAWAAPALPFARRAESGTRSASAAVPLTLDAETGAGLERMADRLGVSEEALLLACWQTLQWRLTGEEVVTVGLVVSGRKFEELEGACGLFAKVVPVRSRPNVGDTLGELARRVGEAVGDAREWQEWFIWPEGDEGASSFFPVGFEYREPARAAEGGGVTFTPAVARVFTDRFDLQLVAGHDEAGHLRFSFEYDPQRLGAAAVGLLAEQFGTLLSDATARPEAAVGDLELLSAAERGRLIEGFNATAAEYPREKLIQQLFEEQAARTPDAAAILFRGEQLSYAELDARSNRLARRLRGLGVGPESLVGVYCERSPELLVALLGVLKAGGAYLPLDLIQPQERIAFMLEDAGTRVLLTQERLLERLPACDATVVSLDADWGDIASEDAAALTPVALPAHPAYVIYTSGSTGRPKGVVVTHGGVVNYLHWAARAYDVGASAGALVHSPVGFDLTVTTLFSPLLVGRTVVLVPEEEGVHGLGAALREADGQSLVKLTPSHLELLNQLLPPEAARSAAVLVVGGEALTAEHVAFWRSQSPSTRIVNEYGPTETVVGCCVYELPAGEELDGALPIGRPIANTQLYVLDERQRPVPTLAAGELYIGGDGLARGYLGQPSLTAERFVPDPFSTELGARLYRTGDLARHHAEGRLEFLGRVDDQVKVRGFRVELGEIEAALAGDDSVSEAAVALRGDAPGGQRLVAYYVGEAEAGPLRERLRLLLPDYMVPSAYVRLARLPLTPNGKVDRRALPAPLGQAAGAAYTAPRTEAEQIIAALWSEVLGVERVGVDDNFFDLGGHSLLLVRVSRGLQEAFGREIQVIDLFKYPTVQALAVFLSEGGAEGTAVERSQQRAQERKDSAAGQRELREKRRALKGASRG